MAGNDSSTALNTGSGGDSVRDLAVSQDSGAVTKQQVVTLGSPLSEAGAPAFYGRLADVDMTRQALRTANNDVEALLNGILGELQILNTMLGNEFNVDIFAMRAQMFLTEKSE